MMMDSVPGGIDFNEVRLKLENLSDEIEVNDLHIWQIGSEDKLLSEHLKTKDLKQKERVEIINNIKHLLEKDFQIEHYPTNCFSKEVELLYLDCNHCN